MTPDLSRRAFLLAAACAPAFAAAPGACLLTPEETEGPYYVPREMVRSNLAEDRRGVPLKLQIKVVNFADCHPLRGAAVDVWHCDAEGEYSGYGSMPGRGPGGPPPMGSSRMGPPPGPPPMGPPGMGPPPPGFGAGPGGPPPKMQPVNKKTFLRGIQHTDDAGLAEFQTIYPGWYEGRCIHIHLKVHTAGHVAHTGQLYLPEGVSDEICRLHPYSRHEGDRMRQSEDGVFQSQHGRASIVQIARADSHSLEAGLVATAILGVDPNATPHAV